MKESKIKQFDCGAEHTIVLTEDDNLFGFGRNEEGQLGNGSNE